MMYWEIGKKHNSFILRYKRFIHFLNPIVKLAKFTERVTANKIAVVGKKIIIVAKFDNKPDTSAVLLFCSLKVKHQKYYTTKQFSSKLKQFISIIKWMKKVFKNSLVTSALDN